MILFFFPTSQNAHFLEDNSLKNLLDSDNVVTMNNCEQ